MISSIKTPGIIAFCAVIMWSFSFPASKLVLQDFTVIDIVLFRYLVASIFFIPLFFSGKINRLKREDLPVVTMITFLGVTFYQLLFVFGVSMVTPAAASMIISMSPIFAALVAFILFGKKLSKVQMTGIFIGFLGVVIITTSKGTDGSIYGFSMMITAAVLMGTYFVLQKPLMSKYTPLDLVCYNTWIGTISLLWGMPSLLSSLTNTPSLESIISIVIMGVFSSGIAFILWFWAISKSEASIISMYLYVQPVIVGSMSWLWLNETPSMNAVLGGVVVLIALVIANVEWKKFALMGLKFHIWK